MSTLTLNDIETLYKGFEAPIAQFDCGDKCSPYNAGVPFCCDTDHAIPSACNVEWQYLKKNTDLWHRWESDDAEENEQLQKEAGPETILIACKGHTHCQREFRSIVCRAFPFFPYLNSQGMLLGLSYYWDYEDRCWVISNLQTATPEYREQLITTYSRLFAFQPVERDNFFIHSGEMRRVFQERHRAIPLIHRNGAYYKITPHNERMRRVKENQLPKFGPYRIADALPFPDEV